MFHVGGFNVVFVFCMCFFVSVLCSLWVFLLFIYLNFKRGIHTENDARNVNKTRSVCY